MLIFYPRIENGNVLWVCDNCGDEKRVVSPETTAVALVCMCDGKVHPQCNNDWYYKRLYFDKQPYEERLRRYETYEKKSNE